jgi:hypothetical protein
MFKKRVKKVFEKSSMFKKTFEKRIVLEIILKK